MDLHIPSKSGDNIPQEEKFIDWILIENPDIIAYQELDLPMIANQNYYN